MASEILKTTVKAALCVLYKYSGVAGLQQRVTYVRGQSQLAILIYHRVTDLTPPDPLTVSVEFFRRTCKLLRRGFHVVSLAEIGQLARSGQPVPSRTVAITFDDTYRDNLEAAHILAEHGLTASFFIPTQFVGSDYVYPWDRHLPVTFPNLTWRDISEMAALGHTIGSHTVTHPNMAAISREQAWQELTDSKKTLEDRLGQAVEWFAFPFGAPEHCPVELTPMIEEAGYRASFSAHGGFIPHNFQEHILPREQVPAFRSSLNLELHLAGCLHWMYAWKRRRRMGKASECSEAGVSMNPVPAGSSHSVSNPS